MRPLALSQLDGRIFRSNRIYKASTADLKARQSCQAGSDFNSPMDSPAIIAQRGGMQPEIVGGPIDDATQADDHITHQPRRFGKDVR